MSEIVIRFRPFFEEPMLTGVKVCTSRTKRMGKAGDTFIAFGERFELLSVEDVALGEVATFWRGEGCRSREHFVEVWKEIHPKTGYSEYQRVYMHWFNKRMRT